MTCRTERMQTIRAAILDLGIADAPLGNTGTFADGFARLYGEPLVLR